MTENRKLNVVFLILGICFPFAVRLLFPEIHHDYDVKTFVEWTTFSTPFQAIYTTECFCNYPVIGLLASTGMLNCVGNNLFYFFLFLALIESINVLLFWTILRRLQISWAGCWAFLFMILPSTWSGGALWGQIDHLGLLFLFLVLHLFISFRIQLNSNRSLSYIGLFIAGIIAYFALFTKQLMIFPLIPIGLGMIALLIQIQSNSKKLLSLGCLLVGFLIPFLFFENWLISNKLNHITHYEQIIRTGSDHMNIISGNGVNSWLLFYADMFQDSSLKIAGIISPKTLGLILFASSGLLLSYQYFKKLKFDSSPRFQLGLLAFFIVVFNLSFNLFLTGTHERYLFYGYPFLLLSFLALNIRFVKFQRLDQLLFLVAAIVYGIFVLAILQKWLRVDDQHVNSWFHKLNSAIQLLVFLRLIWIGSKITSEKANH